MFFESVIFSLAIIVELFNSAIEAIVDQVIAANPDNVAAFHNGKTNLKGWFVGQVLKESKGKANPQIVNELLDKKL